MHVLLLPSVALAELAVNVMRYLYGVATAYSTNENPSKDKLSRVINYCIPLHASPAHLGGHTTQESEDKT